MIKVVGVRFRTAGKIYYFDPQELELKRGTHVIVETSRGVEYGTVIVPPKEVPDDQVILPLKEIIRIATEDDETREAYNRAREHEAYLACKEKIREHGLKMKLIKAEYIFDNSKLIFYFTADGRVDFRSLVKDLAGVFRTRIELRQVGVRDETKLLGGIGICGRELCCHSFLSDFAPVSIRMAKEQNLSLNPSKISGVCGRLMCCLKNETETYEYLNSRLPRVGDKVTTPDGLRGTVQQTNVLRQLVRVLIEHEDEKEIREYPAEELKFRPRGQRKQDREKRKNRERQKETLYSSTDIRGRNRGHKNAPEPEHAAEKRHAAAEPWSRKSGAEEFAENPSAAAKKAGRSGRDRKMQEPTREEAAAISQQIRNEHQGSRPEQAAGTVQTAAGIQQNVQPSPSAPAQKQPPAVRTVEKSQPLTLSGNGNPIGSVVVHNEKFVQNKAGELSRTTTHDVQAHPQTTEENLPSEGLNVKVTEEIKVVKEKTIDPSGRPVLKGFEVHETETVKVSGVIPKEPEAARRTVAAAASTIAEAKADALKEAQNSAGKPAVEAQTAEVVKNVLEQEELSPETADVVNAVFDTANVPGEKSGQYEAKPDDELNIIDAAAEAAPVRTEESQGRDRYDRGNYRNNRKKKDFYSNKKNSSYRKKKPGQTAEEQDQRSNDGKSSYSGSKYYTGSSTHGNSRNGSGSRKNYGDRRGYSGKDSRQMRDSGGQRKKYEKSPDSEYRNRSRSYSRNKNTYKNRTDGAGKGEKPDQ